MRIKEVKQGALTALKNRWGFAVLLTFVTYLIAAGIPGLIDFLVNGFPSGSETEYSQSTLANIVSLLLVPLFFLLLGTIASGARRKCTCRKRV